MKRNHVYHFGSFTLNSLSRELNRNSEPVVLAASAFDCLVYLIEHRERPVGKDELISAVWARSDVSENLVAQTIVRLRRTIDDVDSEQSCIKTVVRVGYRWMLDTSVAPQAEAAAVVETPSNESSDFVVPAGSERIVHYSMVRRALRSPITIFFLLTFAIGVAYFYPHANRVNTTHKEMHFEGKTAIVLPVKVDAPDEWKWLSFGLMDMISSQLRQAKVPTENSQSVVNLLNQPVADSGDWRASFALVISPNASLINAAWHVHLDARGKDGKSWQAEASATDVLSATRTASDLLLAEIGFSSQVKEVALSANSIEEYLLRIEAAQLANASDLAHALIDKAPSDVRRSPEFAYTEGLFNCNENKVAPCEQILSGLLKQLTAADEPLLRAKVLTVFWYIDYHKHLLTDGLAALDEAVRLLLGQKDTEALANAYLARSHIEYYQSRLDDSAADLGSARANYILAGDTAGEAKVNFWSGMIAQHRGHFAEAVPLMQQAYEQYQRMGMRQVMSTPLGALAFAKKMLLLYPDELAITDRYWPFEQKRMNFSDSDVRHDLVLTRAIALGDNGRRSEANDLLEQLLTEVDAQQEADEYAEINGVLARLALERGDSRGALSRVSRSIKGTGPEEDIDKRASAEIWLIYVDALQRSGHFREVDGAVAAMEAWAAHLPEQDDWVNIQVLRAKATQAWGEGQRDQSIEQFKNALALAEKLGVPDLVAAVGLPYTMELLNTGHVDRAIGVSGVFSPSWSSVDWRVAWAQANIFKALGQQSAWEASRLLAQRLAGDRTLPTGSSAFAY